MRCTLTGIDDKTPLDQLWEIPSRTPFIEVEWGVLYSHNNEGMGRYPKLRTIDIIAQRLNEKNRPFFALHICGVKAVTDLLMGIGHVSEVAATFDRIQINFRSASFPMEQIKATLERQGNKTVITQHNTANLTLVDDLRGHRNHAILFDASGGRGITPTSWPVAYLGTPCGYAGGLGPTNIASELPPNSARGSNHLGWSHSDLEAAPPKLAGGG